MRFSEMKVDDESRLFDDARTITSPASPPLALHRDDHSSIQCHAVRQDRMPISMDRPSPSAEYIYTAIVKAIGTNEFIDDKRLLKRASWSPSVLQEHGLPPTGKRADNEQSPIMHRNPNRVRLRPKVARYYQPQLQERSLGRPVSFNEKFDRHLVNDHQQGKLPSSSMNRASSFSIHRREPSPSPSSSSVDTIVQITTRASPSLDTSDFISDTSTASSVTTTNTVTSLSSTILSQPSSRRRSPSYERVYSSTIRPLLSEYQQPNSSHIDYKFSSPVSRTHTVHSSSPISSFPTTSFTCPKGHEQSLSSSSSPPVGSSLNQYGGFTLQTLNIDTTRDDIDSPTTKTTRSIMTMSMSPNRHPNQTRSAKAIITSAQISPATNVTITANNTDGLKQQRPQDQTESTSVSNNGCLKSPTSTNNNNRIKKSVHFDWHLPKNIRSTSPLPVKESCTSRSNYRPTATIASSSPLSNSNGNSDGDNDEQKKLYDDQRLVGTLREKERIETARRTIITNPLTTTTSTILRSFSLSPSPLSKAESNNDSRRHREAKEEEEEEEEKKENVDELNCTTSRRVTTAATHLHCTTTTATVTFNDGSNNVSQKKESNSTNNSNTNLLKRQSFSVDQSMPLNNLLVKTSSLNTIINPQQSPSSSSSSSTSAKKLISNGFLSLIGRSNSSNNKSSTATEENKQLRRTSSTQLRAQRKAKQQLTLTTGTNGNQRLSADVESILPVSSINNNHCEISKEDIHTFDKVTTNHNSERQSLMSLISTSTDKNISATSPLNIDSPIPLCTNSNGINNSMSMSTNSSTTLIKSDEGDSLNNGLLFRPVTDPKSDYVLHNHQTVQKEPFFLSPPKSLSNGDESTLMQTSTLIISTPPQYHYYLYPPINNANALSSSSSSSSSSVSSSSKKNTKITTTTNRTISNVSINSLSTNSSSSYPSYESHTHDNDYQQSSQIPLHAEDETLSSSTYSISNNTNKTRQKKVVQSALIDWKMKSSSETNHDCKTKPVILSDSVQAFWPPPPSPSTLDKHAGLTTMTLTTTEQTKQSESIPTTIISSSYITDSMNMNHTDRLFTKEEIGSYTEQHQFSNGCLRNASDTSLEDTQASYTERLREKSRSIPMNGNPDMYSYLKRSVSKDTLNDCHLRSHTHLNVTEIPLHNETTLRPKSAGQQTRTTHIISRTPAVPSETDFQSKREFFENRLYTDNASSTISLSSIQTNILPTKPKLYTLSPSNHSSMNNNLLQQTVINNNPQRNITRRSWNDLSSRQLPPPPTPPPPPPPPLPPPPSFSEPYFESSFHQTSLPAAPTIRKPVRIVKAIQRSSPPSNEPILTTRPLTTSKTYSLAKPGLFSASPITSSQKLPNKSLTTIRRFQSRDENDLQFNLKEFLSRYSHNHSSNDLARLTTSNDYHLSTDYTRALFPIPDRLRRIRSRQSSGGDTSSITTSSNSSSDYIHRTVSNDSCIFDEDDTLRQAEDLLLSLKKRLENLKENQRIIHEETDDNRILGAKLINIIETNAESNEIEKFKLHINEIDTITSILLKLSSRLARVENDLAVLSDNNEHTKTSLLDRREKAQQKHDEAKSLKDGIDRRSRLVTNILRKYFSNDQYDDYEHFIRMKSTLLMDEKDVEENISLIEKQIELLNRISLTDYRTLSTSNTGETLSRSSWKAISSMA